VNRREKIKEWLLLANRFDEQIYTAKHNYASFNIINWELNYWRRSMNFSSHPSSSCNDTVNCRTLWVKPDFVYLENYQFCAPPMYRPSFYTCTKSHFYNFWKFSQIKGSYMHKNFVTSKIRIHTSMYTSPMFRYIHQRGSSSCFCKSVSFLAFL